MHSIDPKRYTRRWATFYVLLITRYLAVQRLRTHGAVLMDQSTATTQANNPHTHAVQLYFPHLHFAACPRAPCLPLLRHIA